MAKINARLGDVEVKDYVPVTPARYVLKIAEVKESTKEGRQNFNFEFQIDDGGELQGRKIYHNCAMNLKDGGTNEIGAGEFKRIAAAVLGISKEEFGSYDWDSLDSDDLKLGRFEADVKIKPWTNPVKGTSGEGPVIVPHTIGPVS